MNNSKIEWTDKTWNPVTGCTKVSQGCKNCYAETFYERFNGKGSFKQITCHEDRLTLPLKWKNPSIVFVNSMSDLFHEDVPFKFIDQVFAIMALTRNNTYQILTKRQDRLLKYFESRPDLLIERWATATYEIGLSDKYDDTNAPFCAVWNYAQDHFPLPNVWIGVSVEDQKTADERIPLLLQVPAAVRFLSCEPLLGPVDLKTTYEIPHPSPNIDAQLVWPISHGDKGPLIHWVICGGESGHKARPMHPDWARQLRDQCKDYGIPFFFKQWGEWYTHFAVMGSAEPTFKMYHSYQHFTAKDWVEKGDKCISLDGTLCEIGGDFMKCAYPVAIMNRVGKKNAGRILDGKEWNQMPAAAVSAETGALAE